MTNCEHFRFLSSDGKTQLHACLWIPDEKIKFRAVLQIAHGVAEHIERYDDFARYLNEQGIVVAGHDHLGHGQSLPEGGTPVYFGEKDGWKHLVDDDTKEANVYALVHHLSTRLKENQITVVGNGSACVAGGHGYTIKKGQRFITNSAIASMGYDLPAAIGAWEASKNDGCGDVILLTGDGSIQMNLQELQTIIHHRMGIKIFLINNQGYHSIRQTQKNFFGEPLVGIGADSGDLSFPDMEKLAAAYGYPYVKACHNSQLPEAIEKTLSMEGPVICEIFVTTDQNFEPKSSAKRLPDGTLVSPPLEDLSPFLSEEEMDANMIIPRIRS